jgi:KipI family sensor histidine kinase inhibitor
VSVSARPYGDTAVLLEVDAPVPVVAALTGAPGVLEAVAGACTVLARIDPGLTTVEAVAVLAGEVGESPAESLSSDPVRILVRYDGPDLEWVAQACSCSVEAVIARHSAGVYTVAFTGFAPGFAYLTGLDPTLHVARREEPRSRVPAGAVAIAGEYSAVYPRSSPGGWRLLGQTDLPLWDTRRDPPTLLTAGTQVRFAPS